MLVKIFFIVKVVVFLVKVVKFVFIKFGVCFVMCLKLKEFFKCNCLDKIDKMWVLVFLFGMFKYKER